MSNKAKWYTVLVCFVLLILASACGLWRTSEKGSGIGSADDLKGARLGGVSGRMPDNSAEIFFESMIGRNLRSYNGYGNIDECLYALRSGRVDAVWTTDVTAEYLLSKYESLAKLDTSDMAAIENNAEPRFSFGMAAANNAAGRALTEKIDYALDYLSDYGILDELTEKYIKNAKDAEPFTVDDMLVNDNLHKVYYYSSNPLVVGVTGAVPPIELLDGNMKPYGFCVALMDEIGQVLQCGVKFVVLDNETAFSSLMSGRVDLIFCYGTGMITTEGSKSWCMTKGYYDMQKYEFLYVK